MKKTLIYLSIALLSIVSSSCRKWLEEDPSTSLSIDKLHGEADMRALLIGTFVPLKSLVEMNSNLDLVGTDECRLGKLDNKNTTATNIDSYIITSSFNVVQNAWTNCYNAIQSANVTINRTTLDRSIAQDKKDDIIGQARFLRAWAYFKLVQWFGALPLVTDETADFDPATIDMGRSPVKDVYALIVSDLLFASTSITAETPSDNRGSGMLAAPTKSAARAMLAKVYLTMGTSKARLTYPDLGMDLSANAVLNQYKDLPLEPEDYYRSAFNLLSGIIGSGRFRLQDQFLNNFTILYNEKFTNGESMWELPFSDDPGYGSNWSKLFGQNCNGPSATLSKYNAQIGQYIFAPVPNFWWTFRNGDLRRKWTLTDQFVNYQNTKNPDGTTAVSNDITTVPNLTGHAMPAESKASGDALIPYYMGQTGTDLNTHIACVKYRWGGVDANDNHGNDIDSTWVNWMPKAPTTNVATNEVVLRYADVLLMYVEADMLLHGGSPAPGDRDLGSVATQTSIDIMNNQILFRARGNRTQAQMLAAGFDQWGAPSSTPMTADPARVQLDYTAATLTFAELMRQRSCELSFEFHRWDDLSRWGVLREYYNHRLSSLPLLTDKVRYLFPVPQIEINTTHNDKGMYQNPGY